MRFLILFSPFFLFAGWAEEELEKMTLEEKIGQLFVAPACPLREEEHWEDWLRLMRDMHIGNAILKHSDPVRQVEFLNRLQAESKLPLLVTADAEWGLSMRMANTVVYPRNMTLGAIADSSQIYRLGKEIARQARLVGIHMNLAPVADVNNNPKNPIIHMRSFGEHPEAVARHVSAFTRGMQVGGILACVKHFPGHGDTAVDSHHDLPFIPYGWDRLRSVELVPFQRAIEEGAAAVMSAHLHVPWIDDELPTSLSPACLKTLLRQEMGFGGLIVSDALNMSALTKHYSTGEISILARIAGCDLLLYGDHMAPNIDKLMREDIPQAYAALKKGYELGHLDLAELDESVLRILRAKEKLGIHLERALSTENLLEQLHAEEAVQLKQELYQQAVTLVGEPVVLCSNAAYVSVGGKDGMGEYFNAVVSVEDDLSRFDQVVFALRDLNLRKEHFGIPLEVLRAIEVCGERTVVCLFGTPYALPLFTGCKSVLVGYETEAEMAVFRVLEGAETPQGKLPIHP